MQVWNVLHTSRWKYRMQKWRKNRHLGTITQLCRAESSQLQSEKNLLNSKISSTCPHNMVNFSPLAAEIGSGIWGTPVNFNGFCILASLLHQRRSPEDNQTLHDVWMSPGMLHYIYFRGLLPLMEFRDLQNSLFFQVLRSPVFSQCYWGVS